MAKKSERQKKLERFATVKQRRTRYKYLALIISAIALGILIFMKYFLKS